jgi:hypothetical protein
LPVGVVSAAQILVFVANVGQNPSSAYSVSGTTLTFTSAPPTGTNNIWVEYTSLQTNTIAPSAGTVGTAAIQSGVTITSPTIVTPTINQINNSVTGSSLGAGNASIMKNRIINGAMVIDQRNAGASVTNTTSEIYTLDRFSIYGTAGSKFSVQQNAGSVTPPAGFTKYLGITSLAATTPASSDQYYMRQSIEGFNIADLGWGTANAKTVTLSFQVYSSLTGTFGGSLTNFGYNRSYPFTYSIPVANTWTSISVTIAGDTTGTWNTDNTRGISVFFNLGSGTAQSGTAGSWAATGYFSATGSVNMISTNGATLYLTGVQFEVGSSATGFEYVNYQTSLANCQRYYWKSIATGGGQSRISMGLAYSTSATGQHAVMFPVDMRATPTINALSGNYIYNPVIGGASITSLSLDGATSSGTCLVTAGSTGLVAQNNWSLFQATIQFSSEL